MMKIERHYPQFFLKPVELELTARNVPGGNRQQHVLLQNPETSGLKAVIDFLAEVIQPERIYALTNSHGYDAGNKPAGSDNEVIELVVIVPERSNSLASYEPLLEFATSAWPHISCSVHNRGRFMEAIRKGIVYYHIICAEENLVYSSGSHFPLLICVPSLIQEFQRAMGLFTTRFQTAQAFLKIALFEQHNGHNALACFMLHQATEITFRALLESLMGKDIRTHSLALLKRFTRRIAPAVAAIFPENGEVEKALLSYLDDSYIKARYTGDFRIDLATLDCLIERVQKLQEEALLTFNRLIKKVDWAE